MAECNTPARCSEQEYQMAREAGLLVISVADEVAIHRFAESVREEALKPITQLLIELHEREYLSEQQCAKLLGLDLLSWRILEQGPAHPFAQEGAA